MSVSRYEKNNKAVLCGLWLTSQVEEYVANNHTAPTAANLVPRASLFLAAQCASFSNVEGL